MIASSLEDLKCLHEELDFANATRTNFDIDPHSPGFCLGIDFCLERGETIEHPIVMVLAKNEGS